MHASWFSYPVTRPYPFIWFTPIVVTGGIILAAAFSLINLASSGFYLKAIYTGDPNTTISSETRWFMKTPFNWEADITTTCQPNVLSVGDSFFSTTLGLQYKIKTITQQAEGPQKKIPLPSIPYLNNTLKDCFLNHVDLNLHRADNRAGFSWWISWASSDVTAMASCTFVSEVGSVNLALEVQYPGQVNAIYDYVIDDNYTTHAAIWWGTRLLNVYWAGILAAMSQLAFTNSSDYLTDGTLTYTRNLEQHDIRATNFFDLEWELISSSSGIFNNDIYKLTEPVFTNRSFFLSSVAMEGLHHARLLQSLVAADLGNCHSPNLLLDSKDLQYAILPEDDYNRKPDGDLYKANSMGSSIQYSNISKPGTPYTKYMDPLKTRPLNKTYNEFYLMTGPLNCTNATIVGQYLCSIPQRKSTGNMVLAMILADLVFLQAAWTILNWVAGNMLSGEGSRTNFCEGCLEFQNHKLEMESLMKIDKSPEFDRPSRFEDESAERLIDTPTDVGRTPRSFLETP